MAQIKNKQEQVDTDAKAGAKTSLKAAIKMAQKEELELTEKIAKFHHPEIMKPIDNYNQEKTVLQKYLDLPSEGRQKKELKNIKAQLSYLRCFQIHSQDEQAPKEVMAIMKRDLDMLTAIISKFVHPKIYTKSTIIETVGTERKKIMILLRGEIAVFEPINYKSYKNCVKLLQSRKAGNLLLQALKNFGDIDVKRQEEQPDFNQLVQTLNPEQLTDWQDFHHNSKSMTTETAKTILQKVGLIGPTTPHRMSKYLRYQGLLISSDINNYIVSQPSTSDYTAICLGDCYVMELQFEVYKQAIAHLNSDQQKKYIEVLLRRFQAMQYFDAKQYVRKEFMINKKQEEEEVKKKLKENPVPLSELEKGMRACDGREEYEVDYSDDEVEEEQVGVKVVKKKKEESSQTFEIKFDNDLYLIAEGQVTLQIDIIQETRLSTMQFASKVRVKHPRAILKLYEGDLFGVEQLGKIKDYNLTYIVKKESKILLMSQDIYIRHYYEIEGFKQTVKEIVRERNQLICSILSNVDKTVESQQLKKYKSVASLDKKVVTKIKKQKRQSLVPSDLIPPRQLQFTGLKVFQRQESKLKLSIIKDKGEFQQALNLKQFADRGFSLKQSFSFASHYKDSLPANCKVIGDFIEVRNNKGSLIRRRSISNAQTHHENPNKLFQRIGVINDTERNQHNMMVIKRRKSNYEIEDFGKEKKQYERLKNLVVNLPKLENLYAKKSDMLYKNMKKLNYQKKY